MAISPEALHRGQLIVYGGIFLAVGGWSILTRAERPWTSRPAWQRYLILLALAALAVHLLHRQ